MTYNVTVGEDGAMKEREQTHADWLVQLKAVNRSDYNTLKVHADAMAAALEAYLLGRLDAETDAVPKTTEDLESDLCAALTAYRVFLEEQR